jgi:hypothetical protein
MSRKENELKKQSDNVVSNLEYMLANIPDGRKIAISYVRQIALDDEDFKAIARDLDADRKADLGDLCTKYKIAHADFLARIVKESFPIADEALKLSHIISTKVVAQRLPKVVERGMIEAAKSDGVTDRHFVLQKEGFHIAPKGTVINMNQVNQQAAGLPIFEDEARSLSDMLAGEDHQLTEGEPDYIEAEEVEEETVAA